MTSTGAEMGAKTERWTNYSMKRQRGEKGLKETTDLKCLARDSGGRSTQKLYFTLS